MIVAIVLLFAFGCAVWVGLPIVGLGCGICIVVGLQVAFGVCDLVITMVSWCVVVWAVLILFLQFGLSLLGFGGGLGLCVFDYFWMDCRDCMRTLDKLGVVCFVVVNLLWGVWFG